MGGGVEGNGRSKEKEREEEMSGGRKVFSTFLFVDNASCRLQLLPGLYYTQVGPGRAKGTCYRPGAID